MRRKYLLYFLSISSAIFTALAVTCDTYLSVYIQDPWILGTSLFLVGTITAFPLMMIFCIKIRKIYLGYHIDPQFRGFLVPNKDFLKYILIASIANALMTLIYTIIVTSIPDPSIVLSFCSLAPVYLLFADIVIEKEIPSTIEIQSVMMIVLGVFLVSISLGKIPWIQLLLVLGPYNFLVVVFNAATKKLRRIRVKQRHYYDSLNIRFWLVIFSTIFFILFESMLYPFSKVLEKLALMFDYFFILALDMILTFFAYATYIRALAIGKMSIVNALSSLSTVFGFIASIILSAIIPDVFPTQFPVLLWIIKAFGVFLAVLGTITLALTEVKALVFIKVHAGRPADILERLAKIRGVEIASAVAGRWDYILYIRLRTIKQAYYIITNELSRIPDIEDAIWITILREYERI